jgi:hypothetical protein
MFISDCRGCDKLAREHDIPLIRASAKVCRVAMQEKIDEGELRDVTINVLKCLSCKKRKMELVQIKNQPAKVPAFRMANSSGGKI